MVSCNGHLVFVGRVGDADDSLTRKLGLRCSNTPSLRSSSRSQRMSPKEREFTVSPLPSPISLMFGYAYFQPFLEVPICILTPLHSSKSFAPFPLPSHSSTFLPSTFVSAPISQSTNPSQSSLASKGSSSSASSKTSSSQSCIPPTP